MPRRNPRPRQSTSTAPPERLRIKINGRYDLEQLSHLLQQALARLQDAEVYGIDQCALYVVPLGRSGQSIHVRDASGNPTHSIEIALPISARFGLVTKP